MAKLNYSEDVRQISREIRKFNRIKKLMIALAGVLGCAIAVVYIVSLLYSKIGNFTISVDKFENVNYSIALCETSALDQKRAILTCDCVKEATNIDGSEVINNPKIGSVDGVDNGDNYLCYTFYLVNNGESDINVDYYIVISQVEKNLDEAIRVMVISNRNQAEPQKIVYAKAKGVDENFNIVPEDGTTAFTDLYTVCEEKINNFASGDVCKFTVVIWIEGPDDDCENDKIGGRFKIDMKFNISGIIEN